MARLEVKMSDGATLSVEQDFKVLLNVTALTRSPENQLWVGTFEYGLLKYDLGQDQLNPSDDSVEQIDVVPDAIPGSSSTFEASMGLDSNSTLSLLWDESANGLWVGTFFTGFYFVAENSSGKDTITRRYMPPGCDEIPGFPCSKDRFQGEGGTLDDYFERGLAGTITSMVSDGGTGVWIGTMAGLYHFDHGGTMGVAWDDVWTFFPAEGQYDPNIARLTVDQQGRLWIASFDLIDEVDDDDALVVLDHGSTPWYLADDQWGKFPALTDAMPKKLYTVMVDYQDLVWVGTTDGLFVLDHNGTPLDPADDKWAHRSQESGLPDNDIAVVVSRMDGRLWVGGIDVCEEGDGGGLAILELGGAELGGCAPAKAPAVDADTLSEIRRMGAMAPEYDCLATTYSEADGLLDADVTSVIELSPQRVLVGTFNLIGAASIAATIAMNTETDIESCGEADPAFAGEGTTGWTGNWNTTVSLSSGNDGLAVIDTGDDPFSKADDTLVNL